MPFKDECGICGRIFPVSYLRRCWRCGKLYCVDCMIPDVVTGDNRRLLCLNCARRTVSPAAKTKYDALTSYLRFRAAFTDTVKLPFAKIDGIIGDNLPMDAYRSEDWWINSREKEHARAWLNAGWEVSGVNLKEGYVVFVKTKAAACSSIYIAKSAEKPQKPFPPAPSRIFKKRKPSKTKLAKLYARLKNIERRKTQQKVGGLKP